MSDKNQIVIGGKAYDARTGALIEDAKKTLKPISRPQPKKPQTSAAPARLQKPTTLNRDFVKKPEFKPQVVNQIIKRRATSAPRASQNIKNAPKNLKNNFKNRQIRHFAKLEDVKKEKPNQPVVLSEEIEPDLILNQSKQQTMIAEIKQAQKANFFTRHRINQIAAARRKQQLKLLRQSQTLRKSVNKPASKPLKQIKNETLTRAIANAPSDKQLELTRPKTKRLRSFWQRERSLIVAVTAIIIISLVSLYFNLPNIKLRYANYQAQIIGRYPSFVPVGFNLTKEANFKDGKINYSYSYDKNHINFSQQATDWNPQTLLEMTVKPNSDNKFVTDKQRGLTIYYYDKHATWINSGILYQIDYDFNLDSYDLKQIINSF